MYPPAVYYGSRVLTENMAALFAVVATGTFLWAARSRSGWPAAVTGAVWALSALNRPVFLFLPGAMLVTQVVFSRIGPVDWRWSWRRWSFGLAAFALVMAPWTVRNYVEHGVFMPTHSSGGYVLLISNGTLTDHRIQSGMFFFQNPDHQRALEQASNEVEFDAISRQLAIAELKANWRLLPTPLLNRARNFWTPRPDPYDPSWTLNDTIMLLFWGPVLVVFVTSRFARSWRRNWPALALILYAFLLMVPFWGSPRFRFPVDPLILTASAAGLVDLLQRAWRHLATR